MLSKEILDDLGGENACDMVRNNGLQPITKNGLV